MMPPTPSFGALVDTHAHLEDRRLREDIEGVIERARAAGLVQIIAIGTTAVDSAGVIEIASNHRGIFAAVGVQPNHVAEVETGDWSRILELAAGPRVVALGETGLDRYWDRTPFPQQQEWFDRHLALAHDRRLPVVIHCRNCEADVIEQLGRLRRPVQGVLHSFTGTAEYGGFSRAWTPHLVRRHGHLLEQEPRSASRRRLKDTPGTAARRNRQPLPQPSARPGTSQSALPSCLDRPAPSSDSGAVSRRVCQADYGQCSAIVRVTRGRHALTGLPDFRHKLHGC